MNKSRITLITLAAVVSGIVAGFAWGLSEQRSLTDSEKYRELSLEVERFNQKFLQSESENTNLREQIKVLEQRVETLNAEIEEINAVVDRPPSS